MNIVEFTARIVDAKASEGSFTARLVPFGEQANGHEFRKGSLRSDGLIPLTVDHGDSVLDRVGVMQSFNESDTGAYGSFQLSDTEHGRTIRTLLLDGAIEDVSVGVKVDENGHGDVMSGSLHHVSLVADGAFGRSQNPSKVLAVHNQEGAEMPETDIEATAEVVAYNDADLRTELATMADKLDKVTLTDVKEPELFRSLSDFVETMADSRRGMPDAQDKMEKFALAEDTTTTAAGVVPDYLSSEYLSIIDTSRAFNNNIPNDPIGTAGMSVVYPKRTSGPSVAVQATENLEVDSTALVIGVLSVDLLTYAGANKVSQQLITRSQPGFVDILFRELAGQYASVTDAASVAAAVAGAGGTAILADLGADGAATFAAFNVANSAIIAAVRKPADTVWLAPDRWAQLNSLTDVGGRPLLVFGANGPMNAQGQSAFNTMVAQYHGWTVRLDVDAAAGTCLIGWSDTVANLEQSPIQLSALQVDTLSTDIGIYGLQNIAIKFAGGLYTLTAA